MARIHFTFAISIVPVQVEAGRAQAGKTANLITTVMAAASVIGVTLIQIWQMAKTELS